LASGAVDQPVLKTLMIAFAMIVRDELANGPPEVTLAQRNHPIETFLRDGSHEPLGARATPS
jgi:hypothetical protein